MTTRTPASEPQPDPHLSAHLSLAATWSTREAAAETLVPLVGRLFRERGGDHRHLRPQPRSPTHPKTREVDPDDVQALLGLPPIIELHNAAQLGRPV
jgi:hypothetical protein